MIIDGKKIAEEILAEVKKEVALRQAQGESFRLAAVLIEPNHLEAKPPSGLVGLNHLEAKPPNGVRKFLELKRATAKRVGVDFRLYEFPVNITTQKLRKEIVGLAKAGVNHGVLIELPLPQHINTQYVLNAIPSEKDVDVLSEKSQGAFFANRSVILPPAVEAVKIILEKNNINLRGKNCAIFGYGLLVGKPINHWLASQGATISVINKFTANPEKISRQADVVISGVGKPGFINDDMIKEGAIVIDFGYTTRLEVGSEKLAVTPVGDVDFAKVNKKSSFITPVPGGVGPIVIAAVFKNLVALIKKTSKK